MREIKIVRLLLIILTMLVIFLGYKYYKSFEKTQIISISHSQIEDSAVTKLAPTVSSSEKAPTVSSSEKHPELIKIESEKADETDASKIEEVAEVVSPEYLTKEQVEVIIHDYIMNNPTVIIDSTIALQNKKQQEELEKSTKLIVEKKAEIEDLQFYPYIGPKNVTNKIVMFYDYNCSYCKNANIILNEIIANYPNVQVIYRPFPILGEESKYLAKIMLTVFQIAPEKFKLVHDDLMTLDNIKLVDLNKILSKNNINIDANKALKNDLELLKKSLSMSDEAIITTLNLAKSINIRGVPAFIINDKLYPGVISYDTMKMIVEHNINYNLSKDQGEQLPTPISKEQ